MTVARRVLVVVTLALLGLGAIYLCWDQTAVPGRPAKSPDSPIQNQAPAHIASSPSAALPPSEVLRAGSGPRGEGSSKPLERHSIPLARGVYAPWFEAVLAADPARPPGYRGTRLQWHFTQGASESELGRLIIEIDKSNSSDSVAVLGVCPGNRQRAL